MCVVSMVSDHYQQDFQKYILRPPGTTAPGTAIVPAPPTYTFTSVSPEEFESLKKEVEHMKALLIKAKIYDAENNEPDCEIEEKMEFLRKIAEFVGVNLDEVIKKQ